MAIGVGVMFRDFVKGCVSVLLVSIALLSASAVSTYAAAVRVHIDRGSQTMRVYVGGYQAYYWSVSTGKRGYRTPRGTYRPTRLARRWYSRKYYNSPMPYSIFFRGGYAIHGTGYVKQLGRPASHGCVRLAPGNAATLFRLVKRYGRGQTRITIR